MKSFGFLLWLLIPLAGYAQNDPVAPAACAKCHVEALTQPTTFMAHALEAVDKSKVLIEHPVLSTTVGKYSYRIERKGDQSEYSVTDGTNTVTMAVRWAMGADFSIGQTYILEKDGHMFESRVSWFRELNGLGPTLGYVGTTPADLQDAAGRLLGQDEKLRCFGCHATNAVHGKQLALDHLIPGVQCEHCHQGTAEHLAAMQLGNHDAPASKELSRLIGLSGDQAPISAVSVIVLGRR